jgi:hypothetical protein
MDFDSFPQLDEISWEDYMKRYKIEDYLLPENTIHLITTLNTELLGLDNLNHKKQNKSLSNKYGAFHISNLEGKQIDDEIAYTEGRIKGMLKIITDKVNDNELISTDAEAINKIYENFKEQIIGKAKDIASTITEKELSNVAKNANITIEELKKQDPEIEESYWEQAINSTLKDNSFIETEMTSVMKECLENLGQTNQYCRDAIKKIENDVKEEKYVI